MAQARRKLPPRRKNTTIKPSGNSLVSIAMLLTGMLIGSLSTTLWHGAKTPDSKTGAGIRRMLEITEQLPAVVSEQESERLPAETDRPSTNFTFFTVLPEIEVVAPTEHDIALDSTQITAANTPKTKEAAGSISYMLQAGSYQRRADADRLKANLALNGATSTIQKVTIEGRGDFYRVRLGPYPTYQAMQKADQQLNRNGFKTLRLKMFKAG